MEKYFLSNIQELNEFLKYESLKYGRKNKRIPLICIKESDYLWKYNVLLRKTEYHINNNNKIKGHLYKILLYRYGNKINIHIPINVFDKGLKIMHLGPILVNGNVKGGKDISLHVNSSLVASGLDSKAPNLGDGVVVGVGAVVIGDVTIANNIAIGANAVVNKNFLEENIAIAGIPAKKVSNNGRLKWGNK